MEEGETVYEIDARCTAAGCRRARKPGKTDRPDARAVARFVRQEVAHHSPEARAYLDRRTAEGKSRGEAIQAPKRFIVRAIGRILGRSTCNFVWLSNVLRV